MTDEIFSDFSAQWCQDLINSADYVEDVRLNARVPAPPHRIPQSFLAKALKGESTVRAWRTFVSREVQPPNISPEQLLLLSLGTDVEGYERLLHGGMSSALMDQISGMCGMQAAGSVVYTLELLVRYRRSVPLPAVIVCRAAAVKREGNRLWVHATMHDGEGRLCCEADTMFHIKQPKERL